jgi:hypothetical protein
VHTPGRESGTGIRPVRHTNEHRHCTHRAGYDTWTSDPGRVQPLPRSQHRRVDGVARETVRDGLVALGPVRVGYHGHDGLRHDEGGRIQLFFSAQARNPCLRDRLDGRSSGPPRTTRSPTQSSPKPTGKRSSASHYGRRRLAGAGGGRDRDVLLTNWCPAPLGRARGREVDRGGRRLGCRVAGSLGMNRPGVDGFEH